MKESIRKEKTAGITLFELLATVMALGVVITLASVLIGGFPNSGAGLKFRTQVKMLNSAVKVYRANAGQLDSSLTGEEVIAKLRSVANAESSRKINGLRGRMLDLALIGVKQSAAEAGSGQQRALWSPAKMRFEIATSGPAGFKKFLLDDGGGVVVEEVRNPTFALASSGGWVWDYEDAARGAAEFAPPIFSTPSPGQPPAAGGGFQALPLLPPVFSVAGGNYAYSVFDLPIHFSNPNPVGVSEIFYSIGGQAFQVYAGGDVYVSPGDMVIAYAVSIDPDEWIDSSFAEESYDSTFLVTGSTSGLFSNPVGGPDMVTGGWGNYFTWGTPATWAGFTDPSWILYEGASFINVSPDERFLLGSLQYYNGSIDSGTGADGLDFSIELAFEGGTGSEIFEYDLNLINSANLEGNTADENADYVQFGEIYAEVPATLGGVEYMLILEFGEVTEGGFSNLNEFFVQEGETATGNLYGTLVRAWGEG